MLVLNVNMIQAFVGNTAMTLQNSFGLFINGHFYIEDKVSSCYLLN